MIPKHSDATPELGFDRIALVELIRLDHPLAVLAHTIDWDKMHARFAPLYVRDNGRPGLPLRLLAGLQYIKHIHKLSDEEVVRMWIENPYWQYFCGERYFCHRPPIDPSQMTRFRQRIGEAGCAYLLELTISACVQTQTVSAAVFEEVIVDSTVQPKAIAAPTDNQLAAKARKSLVRVCQKVGLALKRNFIRKGPQTLYQYSKAVHRKHYKLSRKYTRLLRTQLGKVIRDVEGKLNDQSHSQSQNQSPLAITARQRQHVGDMLAICKRIHHQIKSKTRQEGDPRKLAAIHAPETCFIAKGKANKKWECGSKVSVCTTLKGNVIVAIVNHPNAPHDKDTLKPVLAQVTALTGCVPDAAYVDRGYAGHGLNNSNCGTVIHQAGKDKSLTQKQKANLRRRSAIEPVIGHMKTDGHLGRNYLKGEMGDAINAMLSGAGWNLRKVLRHLMAAFLLFYVWLMATVTDRWVQRRHHTSVAR